MRFALLLKFTVICCWVSRQSWVLSITTKGRFIVTDEMYQKAMPAGTIDGSTQISKDKYYSTTKIDAIFECGKRCYWTNNCSSFLLVPGESKCALTTLNRCSDNANLIFVRPGQNGRSGDVLRDLHCTEPGQLQQVRTSRLFRREVRRLLETLLGLAERARRWNRTLE